MWHYHYVSERFQASFLPKWIGRIVVPPIFWVIVALTATATTIFVGVILPAPTIPEVRVAMIGNSMMYYNDLPRFLEALSDGKITQNSCLHGNANFQSILTMGNGMFKIWDSGNARIFYYHKGRIHDYGACTVKQLLFGYDEDLEELVMQTFDIDDDDAMDDAIDDANNNNKADDGFFDDDNFQKSLGDDFTTFNDGSNPCLRNPYYYRYLISSVYSYNQNHKWDYVLMNDNTRTPARLQSRDTSLNTLETVYLPWFQEIGATPIFLATYAYWSKYRDMGGLGSVPEFTSLTMAGYQEYVDMLSENLPETQKPRIAPVGLAFLSVYEENYSFWKRLFHVDQVHAGPLGTYLQGLVVYHTIYGVMPHNKVAVRGDMSSLWLTVRRFQPVEHHSDPFPTQEEAAYLYQIALRVCVYKQVPRSFVKYTQGEASDYVPQDDLFKIDDLF